jgi:phage tail sheath gpL-like
MYKEMANAWRSMQDNPRGEGFMNAMNHLIDISKGFVTTNAADLGFDLGTESLNLLARGTALASSMGEVNNVLYQAITCVSTANNLL